MPIDILLGSDNDLVIENGDLSFGESTGQHQKHLLLANKGSFKQSPVSGVGIGEALNDDDLSGLYAEIQKQFTVDGMTVAKIDIFKDGQLEIDASYEDSNS